jgi:hypothetical protein
MDQAKIRLMALAYLHWQRVQNLLSKGILRKKHTSSGTNPPGVSLNRLELKKQMRYFFRAKIFCVLQKNVLGKFLA